MDIIAFNWLTYQNNQHNTVSMIKKKIDNFLLQSIHIFRHKMNTKGEHKI